MGDFLCPNRGQQLAFENSVCLSCGGALGFALDERALLVIASGDESVHGGAVDSSQYQLCANLHVAECNWLVKVNPGTGAAVELCTSFTLTRARPNDTDTAALAAFAAAEKARRRLVVELHELSSGHAPKLGKWCVSGQPVSPRRACAGLSRCRRVPGPPVDQAEQPTRCLIGKPERHLGGGRPGVAQPEPAALRHPRDSHPGKVKTRVELDDLDDPAHRHRADLPAHLCTATRRPAGPRSTSPTAPGSA